MFMRSSRLNIHFGEKHIKNVLARFEIENLATTLLYVVAKFFIKCTPLTASSSISVCPAVSPCRLPVEGCRRLPPCPSPDNHSLRRCRR